MRQAFLPLAALVLVGSTAGCDKKTANASSETAAPAVETGTLATAVGDDSSLKTVANALKGTGLATVFDGSASYTLLAPTDTAFEALGATGKALAAPENGAAMAGLLKAHILPGYMTVADIDAAIAKNDGKPVKMATMAGGDMTFAKDGDKTTVSAPDGSKATLAGKGVAASNGVAIPIDAVLKKVPESPPA